MYLCTRTRSVSKMELFCMLFERCLINIRTTSIKQNKEFSISWVQSCLLTRYALRWKEETFPRWIADSSSAHRLTDMRFNTIKLYVCRGVELWEHLLPIRIQSAISPAGGAISRNLVPLLNNISVQQTHRHVAAGARPVYPVWASDPWHEIYRTIMARANLPLATPFCTRHHSSPMFSILEALNC